MNTGLPFIRLTPTWLYWDTIVALCLLGVKPVANTLGNNFSYANNVVYQYVMFSTCATKKTPKNELKDFQTLWTRLCVVAQHSSLFSLADKFVFLNAFHQSYVQKCLGSPGLKCDSRLRKKDICWRLFIKILISHWSNWNVGKGLRRQVVVAVVGV